MTQFMYALFCFEHLGNLIQYSFSFVICCKFDEYFLHLTIPLGATVEKASLLDASYISNNKGPP